MTQARRDIRISIGTAQTTVTSAASVMRVGDSEVMVVRLGNILIRDEAP